MCGTEGSFQIRIDTRLWQAAAIWPLSCSACSFLLEPGGMAASLSPTPSLSPLWAAPPSTSCTPGCPASLSPLATLPGPGCISFTTRSKSGSSALKAETSLLRLSAQENSPSQRGNPNQPAKGGGGSCERARARNVGGEGQSWQRSKEAETGREYVQAGNWKPCPQPSMARGSHGQAG